MREHVDIRAILPQRHPLLLVDRVLELVPGSSIRTIKAITGTEPCYAALHDGAESWQYDYPRSLMIESLGQSAALLWLEGRAPTPGDGQVLMFVGARDYHFEGSARPGDVLRHEVRLESVVADTAFASGETWVGERRVATVTTLIATRRPVRPPGAPPPAVLAGPPSLNYIDGATSLGKDRDVAGSTANGGAPPDRRGGARNGAGRDQ
jgi:3-hydroxyacyl-[acyl-carrier-protein] dehydratase